MNTRTLPLLLILTTLLPFNLASLPKKRRLAESSGSNSIIIPVKSFQVTFSGNAISNYPIFKLEIETPNLEGNFEDAPYLTISGVEDNITYSTTLECTTCTETTKTSQCKSSEPIYGTYSSILIYSGNLLYDYTVNETTMLDKEGSEVTGNYFVYYGDYDLSEDQIWSQILTADNQNILFNLTTKYSGSLFFFDSYLDEKEQLECRAYGDGTGVCSGGVVNFNVPTYLYYVTREHEMIPTNISVINKYSIAIRDASFPVTDMSCSSINKGYKFTITTETTNITDFNRSEPLEIELENDSNGLITSISATCYIGSDMKTFDCTTNRAGKGGKTYYLQNKSGKSCIPFKNGVYCIYIYNVNIFTTIKEGYVGLDPTKNKDLSYNKAQLSLSDYPKVINVYFREQIKVMPTNIKAGDVPLNCCAIGEDFNFYCNISESTLYGVEDAPSTYKSYEVTFYDICGNYRRGPTVKVAGMNSDADDSGDDGDAEPEHDYNNNSNEFFLKVNKMLLLTILTFLCLWI